MGHCVITFMHGMTVPELVAITVMLLVPSIGDERD
jgi:hypothetical protein